MRRTLPILIVVIPLLVAGMRELRVGAMDHYLSSQRYEDVYYVPPPAWLQVFSLGYDAALADLLWIRALVYFGEEIAHRGEVRHLYNYTEAILSLDERFKRVYHWVASAALYRTGTITADDARRAIDFLERAVELFPQDGELAWDLGATYRFELVPLLDDPKEKAKARRLGVEHLQVAVLRGAGPPWLALTNATQLEELGRTEQAIRHLEESYAASQDPDVREQIARRLARLRSQAHAEAFRHAIDQLEARRQRHFPYLSTDLFLLVGRDPPVDGMALLRRNFDPLASPLDDPSRSAE